MVSLRSVSAGFARAGLPYFTGWTHTLGERLGGPIFNSEVALEAQVVECTTVDVPVAAVQLNIYPCAHWHGTSRLRSDGLAERIQIASFSLMGNGQTDERMMKSGSRWYYGVVLLVTSSVPVVE